MPTSRRSVSCRVSYWISCWSLVVSALACAYCNTGPAPRDVKLEATELVLSTDPIRVEVYVRDASGKRDIKNGPHKFSVSPAGIGEISDQGIFVCNKSGDATISIDIKGVGDKTKVRCRLVHDIRAKNLGRVDISGGTFDHQVEVVDKKGKVLSDVPLELSSLTPGVVKVEQSRLVPVNVGRATIIARSGQVKTDFTVDIVRRLRPEALPINNDRSINFSLKPGKYELVVKLPVEKQLTAEWRGAPYCNYKGTAKIHVVECVLRAKGGVVFDNPAYILRGETTVSHEGIELREIP